VLFSDVEKMLLEGKADLGVIIHENRFTYEKKGLVKIKDLGNYWEKKTGSPVPLGGIVAKRNIHPDLIKKVNALIEESIDYAFKNYPILPEYVRQHSQEMEEDIMRKHIDLYVNDFSRRLGAEGRKAVLSLIDVYAGLRHLNIAAEKVFMD
ncbi:MAG: 1,4-dihydroxy-6-naphthoate synthase, partial [Gemmatimonadaceae bacterium]|nr:1,4-dihydroxy-6-naphthoate synthase [Chitinophagaceae bacterium]